MTAGEALQSLQPYLDSLVLELVEAYYIPPHRTVLFNHPFRQRAPEAVEVEDLVCSPCRRLILVWGSPIGHALATLAEDHSPSLNIPEEATFDIIDNEQTLKQLLESIGVPLPSKKQVFPD